MALFDQPEPLVKNLCAQLYCCCIDTYHVENLLYTVNDSLYTFAHTYNSDHVSAPNIVLLHSQKCFNGAYTSGNVEIPTHILPV